MDKQICVIGGGYWGNNHIKTLNSMRCLGGIVETDENKLKEHLSKFNVRGFSSLDEAIEAKFDGYVVATPASTHYAIGKKLLEKGLNVLLEKPMTLSSEHSRELVDIAERKKANLMVGHVLLFHPAIKKIKELIIGGKVGKLHYLYSNRLNMGKVRTEENVFWSLAPHDVSILDYLVGSPSLQVEAKGSRFLQEHVYDMTMAQFVYQDNVNAHIFVSWLHPFKEQRLVIIGSKGMITFEDSSKNKEIHYYKKHFDFVAGEPVMFEEADEVIPYENGLPLNEELKYFIENLDKSIDIASGQSGHEVVKVLEAVQEKISGNKK